MLIMAEGVVVSKYNEGYLQTVVVGGVAGIVIIIFYIYMISTKHLPFAGYMAYLSVIAFVIGAIVVTCAPSNIRTLIIDSEHITFIFYFGKSLVVKHTDVKSITTYAEYDQNKTTGQWYKFRQYQIEINTGTIISFKESQFENFKEIKNALWQYRLAAFEKLGTPIETEPNT